MGLLKNYDPKQVIVTWKGEQLNNGIADGTFVAMARTNRSFSLNVGGDGGGTRVRSNNRSGTVTLTLRMGSETNAFLSDKLRDEEADPPIPQVGPLEVKDFSGNTLHESPQAFLEGFPDDALATEEGNREWVFLCLELNMDPRGSLEA